MKRRRFKRSKTRTVFRSIGKRVKRYGKKATSMSNPIQIDAMAYGALRAKMSDMLAPITSKIPLGSISDEIGMGFLNYFVAKKTTGIIRNIALKGLVIENARLGEAIISGGILGSVGTSNSNSYVYG
jgi:hypothetical protein